MRDDTLSTLNRTGTQSSTTQPREYPKVAPATVAVRTAAGSRSAAPAMIPGRIRGLGGADGAGVRCAKLVDGTYRRGSDCIRSSSPRLEGRNVLGVDSRSTANTEGCVYHLSRHAGDVAGACSQNSELCRYRAPYYVWSALVRRVPLQRTLGKKRYLANSWRGPA